MATALVKDALVCGQCLCPCQFIARLSFYSEKIEGRCNKSLNDLSIIRYQYKFTVVYCESVNLIGYINSCTRDCTPDPFSTWRATFEPDVT